jgi:chromosome segregation ATPase
VFDLSEGVNVLIGPNNCGKSAVVEAIRAVTENPRGNYMIRHGAKECQVILETGEGDTIAWRRKKNSASYVINDEEIHRGRVPDTLHDLLKMQPVEVKDDAEDFDVHLGEQKSPIFLVDQPGSQVATFFASATDAHYLVQMQDRHRQNVRAGKSRQGELQGRIHLQEESLKKYQPLTALKERTDGLREEQTALTQAAGLVRHLQQQVLILREEQAEISALQRRRDVLEMLEAPPELEPVADLAGQIRALDQQGRMVTLKRQRYAMLEHLPDLPEVEDLSKLKQDIASLCNATKHVEEFHGKQRKVDNKLEAKREALSAYVKQQTTCPQCERPWSEEELLGLLEKGESHDA